MTVQPGTPTQTIPQITEALTAVADANKEVQSLHVSLAELDSRIAELSKETVEADEISQ